MKTAKRYVVTYDGGFIAWEYRQAEESDKGENIWIKESDYAALAAENERLRNAGDELAKNLDWSWEQSVNDSAKAEKEWKAAKEGGRK